MEYENVCTFMHLEDVYIQSNLQCIQGTHFISKWVSWDWTRDLCATNEMHYQLSYSNPWAPLTICDHWLIMSCYLLVTRKANTRHTRSSSNNCDTQFNETNRNISQQILALLHIPCVVAPQFHRAFSYKTCKGKAGYNVQIASEWVMKRKKVARVREWGLSLRQRDFPYRLAAPCATRRRIK